MITGFGSFGISSMPASSSSPVPDTSAERQACESAGNVWTGEDPYPCRSPEYLRGGASASTAAALEQAKSYPGLFCSAAGGKYSWYGTCGCPSGDSNCKSLVKKAKINEILGLPKPAAYALAASVGLLGVVAFMKMRAAKGGKAGGMFRLART